MQTGRKGRVCGLWLLAGVFGLFAAFIGCGGGGGGGGSTTVPGAPANFTANPGDNSVTLVWPSVSGATSYNVYRGTAPGVTIASGTKVSGVQSPYTVSGLVNGTLYHFVVTAVNAAGESGLSPERTATPSATPPPAAPANLRAAAGDNQATVSWDAVSGATSYNLYRGTTSGVTKATGTKISGATSPSVVSPLTNGTKYYFVVTAVNANGESAESFEVSATPAATPPPAAPGGVSATPGNAQATVSWSAVTGAASYNLYWATASGVTKSTGTKVSGATSPSVVSSLTNGTKYYFVVTAVGVGGESAESAEVFATPVAPSSAFSQADLAGAWDLIFFNIGAGSGWFRGSATINSSGGISGVSGLDSSGSTSVPPDGTITFTISSSGVVSEGGVNGEPSFHGQMSSNKLLVIGPDDGWSPGAAGLRVFRKRTGTTFSNTDLENKTFTFHQLGTGTDNSWYYGAGSTNGSRQLTITSLVGPTGPQTPGPAVMLSVNSSGIVTSSTNPSFYGLMTDDKKNILAIETWGTNSFTFIVVTITGQSYTQSDLAGTYHFSALRNALNGVWSYGAISVDTSGNGSYLSYTDSTGGATPSGFTLSLSSAGVLTSAANPSFHGQLSYNKDLSVRTNTNASGRFGLAIDFK